MDSILNQQDDEIYVYYNASKEDAVKTKKRQVTQTFQPLKPQNLQTLKN